ncbi:RagB/SusD family nutrient uptake outer membrane protein [Pedobacter hiemivivus]|uniref:RagB/SusD family nutrient uptake outer membrane protein n=1 Tax=Pedobacter hiemivivus TaxID=2530454 RepID=A0A4R0NEG2_9SPHI|nr:RagB/SusD family nutrient uptake outer membrane protein [Pedobacter hiemivivus]TCC98518.1 RagB/SusD family nutrient uptake outer membrane protein [Pedobacter hiemivivus]
MKHMTRYIYIAASMLLMISGCKKYLDVKPKGLEVPQTYEHFNGLFNNPNLLSYAIFMPVENGASAGAGVTLPVVMSDEVRLDPQYSATLAPRELNAFKWLPDIYQLTEQPAEWAAFYLQNYTFNLIIRGVLSAEGGTDQQKRALLAEAKANRALMHFMVLNLFAKPYNAATASTDPGVPIIEIPEASAMAGARKTVREVYDFIINDLTQAIPDLNERTVSRFRISKTAGRYMLGQVYFMMGEYSKALVELNSAKSLLSNSDVPMALYDYNVMMDIWAPAATNSPGIMPIAPDNQEEIFQKRVNMFGFAYTNSVFLDPGYESIYDPQDQRLKMFRDKNTQGVAIPYKARRSPIAINYGPSIPDLYLMIAECKARTGNTGGAITDLEEFRNKRMPSDVAEVTFTDQNELIKFIVEERLREYACTGKRWFDLRRLSNDPLFSGKTYTHKNGTETYTLTPDRLVLRIPKFVSQTNPAITDNP